MRNRGERMSTIYEVSKLAGVSSATVSRVLNGSDKVRAKTREKVLAAMRELEYRPNPMARSLATNRSNCVGVIVPVLYGPFYGEMLAAIESELREAGKHLIITTGQRTRQGERKCIEFLLSRGCDALITRLDSLTDDELVELAREAGPARGVYGAKITGGGSGGIVAFLAHGEGGERPQGAGRSWPSISRWSSSASRLRSPTPQNTLTPS